MRSLLGWINGHRWIAFIAVVSMLAVSGTWLSRQGGDDPSTASMPAAPSTTTRPSLAETMDDTASPASVPAPPTTTLAAPQLDRPTDPSGSREQHDEPGARQAAIDYLSTVKQRALYLGPQASREVLAVWTASDVAGDELEATAVRLDQLRDALSSAGGEVWWVVSPLAAKVEAYGTERARVSVWTVTVMASGAEAGVDATVAAPQAAYVTGTVELVWDTTRGWSVWSINENAGPTPMAVPDVAPSGPEEFLTALAGFSLIKEQR